MWNKYEIDYICNKTGISLSIKIIKGHYIDNNKNSYRLFVKELGISKKLSSKSRRKAIIEANAIIRLTLKKMLSFIDKY